MQPPPQRFCRRTDFEDQVCLLYGNGFLNITGLDACRYLSVI